MSNYVTIEGRVGNEPKRGTTKNGKEYLSFSVGDYQGKEYGTQYFNCMIIGKSVEWTDISKGTCVSVHGKMSVKKDEKYGNQITVFADRVTNWNDEVYRFDDSGSREGKSVRETADCPF